MICLFLFDNEKVKVTLVTGSILSLQVLHFLIMNELNVFSAFEAKKVSKDVWFPLVYYPIALKSI